MPLISVNAAPFRLDRPSFVIDHAGVDPIQIQCSGRQLTWNANQTFEDIESFCNPRGEAPGAVERSVNLQVNQSFGPTTGAAAGLWNVLQPLFGTLQTFAILLNGPSPCADDNPEVSGQIWIPEYSLVDAAVRKYSQSTLEFRLYQDPVYAYTVAGAVYAAHT